MNIFRRLCCVRVLVCVCVCLYPSLSFSLALCMFFCTNVFVCIHVCVCIGVFLLLFSSFLILSLFVARTIYGRARIFCCTPTIQCEMASFVHQWSLSDARLMCSLFTRFVCLFSHVRKNANVSGYLFHSIGIAIDLLRSYVHRLARTIFVQPTIAHTAHSCHTHLETNMPLGCYFSFLLLVLAPFFFVIKTCAD